MVISPPILLGTIGMDDTLLLMVLALVLLGPKRLPQVGRQIGKLMYEFRKASNDFKFQLEEELRNAEEADRRKREEALAAAQTAVTQAQSAAEKALQAAQQAQTAAEAAQSATNSLPPEAAAQNAPAEPGALALAEMPAGSDEVNTYWDRETAAAETWEEPVAGGAAETANDTLRVQPPSIGEPVPAAHPRRAAADVQEPVAAADEVIPEKKEVAAEEQPAGTEPTAHHG